MENKFLDQLYQAHQRTPRIPSPSQVCAWLDGLLAMLFPEFSSQSYQHLREFEHHFQSLRLQLLKILDYLDDDLETDFEELESTFNADLPRLRNALIEDAHAILQGDPAALSITEVIRSYPGFRAIAVYRIAHRFHQLGVPLIPRILTESAHNRTGIDIHPSAIIGRRFCIDHGTGIVIGETVEIGDDVKLYQGVTLGALSVKKEMAKTKRHPTIEDRVVIYANATILGGETVIGHDSIIGGSVWLTESIPPHSRIYYQGLEHQQTKREQVVFPNDATPGSRHSG